ncbi:Aim39p Ecym_2682 [Eremothecium cymbalariae DBVPG|uniref:Altered inheritance of mitochondria protein 39, mitochondrial n=1 Tax=Eremothecium cymbalariae (strain CBS 270.75 / DBVPG 7215 / KCTC 17166 / NRRL Y-17582) TaxID=931890 RepID=G8JNW7_ERECY|nr:Hypothetical protein Ecym_2682 [Eremothecium cymbalariae DBVPG\
MNVVLFKPWQRAFSTTMLRTLSGNPPDPTHIFTDPKTNKAREPPNFFQEQAFGNGAIRDKTSLFKPGQNVLADALSTSIREQQRHRKKTVWSSIFVTVFGILFGYSVGYKVVYKGEEVFIPVWPAKRSRPLSTKDAAGLNIQEVKRIVEFRVLEKLSMHKMIKEQFGVPLRTNYGRKPQSDQFQVWCEDEDPCIKGIVMRPSSSRLEKTDDKWHRIPPILDWRMAYRPISIQRMVEKFLSVFGLRTSDLFQVVNPDKVLGDFKYEHPLPKRNEHDHSMHICFLGKMHLSPDSVIVYKGQYHVDARLEQIDLLRLENGELVRYVLHKTESN